ncbi:NADPH-dependent FMN reductase [Actinomadura roseirufa]|uniref:NADPH-dependent FMN reductase n=1 Tax=Actinomadura roseirufa TaxID=2094049 RepID=UPI0010419CE2|nr:NAD(P)H-dependent oxidoreductase [Actinomadura roseirufa]
MAADREPIRLAVIVGSARPERLAPHVVSWFTGHLAQRPDMVADVVDLLDARLPPSPDEESPEVAAYRPRIGAADAYVMVAPEYNHSFSGVLKTAIDCCTTEWRAKPVGFVSYGLSRGGGVRAVEHLRQVLAELHAVGVRDAVCFPSVLDHFGDDGGFPRDRAGADLAAKVMLDQLAWWALALREAKARRPYTS